MQIYTFTISEFAIYRLPAYQVAKVITEVKLTRYFQTQRMAKIIQTKSLKFLVVCMCFW